MNLRLFESLAAGPGRYERKFLIDSASAEQADALVLAHWALFTEPYPPRWVNNVYLDDWQLSCYADNRDGIGRRVKARVRWYGDAEKLKSPKLELKLKRGLLGTKASFPLPEARSAEESLARAALPPALSMELAGLSPVLRNRYLRRYFQSADGRIRATVDRAMSFWDLRAGHGSGRGSADPVRVVLELKYAPEHDDWARELSQGFPFLATKSSKYASGLMALGL